LDFGTKRVEFSDANSQSDEGRIRRTPFQSNFGKILAGKTCCRLDVSAFLAEVNVERTLDEYFEI
jgi:hypothetical protein